MRAGDPAQTVYLLRAGHVRIYLLEEDGREVTTAVLGPGQLVGYTALIGQTVYHAFAEGLSTVEVWAMPAGRLLERLVDDPALLDLVFDSLGRQAAVTEQTLGDLVLRPVAQRVANALRRLELLNTERPRLTRELVAGMIGARRESVSRTSSALA
jgi:CRP-like cAMP-binding protein